MLPQKNECSEVHFHAFWGVFLQNSRSIHIETVNDVFDGLASACSYMRINVTL